jgi:hypothetical protein
MKTELVTLCDAATDSGGKLNILGCFDCVWVRQVPATHPHCAIALRLRFNRVEEGDHRFRVNFMDEDGQAVVPTIDGSLTVHFGLNDESTIANLILNIQQIKLAKYGQYSIDVAIDGRQEASLPLFVRKPPQQASSAPLQDTDIQ